MKMKNKGIVLGLGIVAVIAILVAAQNLQKVPGSKLSIGELSIEEKFSMLSNAKTNFCAKADFINYKQDLERLQGSCCSAMDFHRYREQIEGLKKFSKLKRIPEDPYDIPVSLAKEMLGYKNSIQLTAEQQAVYDEAMKMSHEGGPCCCKCWRYDAFEGLAKFLIVEHGFDARQIAEVWDLSDGCGGKGHAHESGL